MADLGVDAMLVSVGADLPWLIGYEAMPLERLTMLVVPVDGEPTLVVPRLEAPRVDADIDVCRIRPWEETENPAEIVAALVGRAQRVAVLGSHLGPLRARVTGDAAGGGVVACVRRSPVRCAPVKDDAEIEALRRRRRGC